jgi:hypothetical protein
MVPTGTIRLAGRRRPWPETVTIRSISGSPVSKTSAIAATEPTFLDQHFLGALRVLDRERQHRDVEVAGSADPQRLNGIGLVLLDTDHAAGSSERMHHDPDAEVHALRVLDHDAMVGGQVGLALRTIDDQGRNVPAPGRGKLDMGRERRAAEAHHAGFLHGAHDLGTGEPFPMGYQPLPRDLGCEAVHLDSHRLRHRPVGMGPPFDAGDDAGRRGVNGHGHEAVGLADLVAPLDVVADGHAEGRRFAGVLAER